MNACMHIQWVYMHYKGIECECMHILMIMVNTIIGHWPCCMHNLVHIYLHAQHNVDDVL